MYNGKSSASSPEEVFKIYKRTDKGYEAYMQGSLSSTYLYAGEALTDDIIFNAGNPNAPVKEFRTRIIMSDPKLVASTIDGNCVYSSTGEIPDGYIYVSTTD
jgi:hypothetical protein